LTDSGINLLLHIGIDTVGLKGKGFEVLVEEGQHVKKGTPLLKIDLEYIRSNASSIVSPIICTDLQDNQSVRLLREGSVRMGDALFAIDRYE